VGQTVSDQREVFPKPYPGKGFRTGRGRENGARWGPRFRPDKIPPSGEEATAPSRGGVKKGWAPRNPVKRWTEPDRLRKGTFRPSPLVKGTENGKTGGDPSSPLWVHHRSLCGQKPQRVYAVQTEGLEQNPGRDLNPGYWPTRTGTYSSKPNRHWALERKNKGTSYRCDGELRGGGRVKGCECLTPAT